MRKNMRVMLSLVTGAFCLVAVSGCKKAVTVKELGPPNGTATGIESEDQAQNEEHAFFNALDAAYSEANQLLDQAKTNEAVAIFENLYADQRWQQWSDRLFAEKIRFLVFLEQADNARDQVQNACTGKSAADALAGLRILLPYTQETVGLPEAIAMAAEIEAMPELATEIVTFIKEWRFFAAMGASDMTTATATFAEIFKSFPVADANRVFSQAVDSLLSNNRLDDVRTLLDVVKAIPTPSPGCAQIIAATDTRLAALSEDWPETARLFIVAAQTLGEVSLKRLLTQITPILRRAKQFETLDKCAEEVLFNQGTKVAAATQAARVWMEAAMANNRAAAPGRLQTLLDRKIDVDTVASQFIRFFYDLINDTEIIRDILPVADELIDKIDAETAKTIKTMRLDGSFVTDDFDKAIAYLKAGIPDRDADWHNMALSKVQAHRALKQNNPREAVKFFQEFMTYIDTVKDDDTVDPSTGIQHSKDMLRGRNAKRIAEILASIPDADAAAKTRAEAAEYFKKALAEAKDDETRNVITAEAGDLLK